MTFTVKKLFIIGGAVIGGTLTFIGVKDLLDRKFGNKEASPENGYADDYDDDFLDDEDDDEDDEEEKKEEETK